MNIIKICIFSFVLFLQVRPFVLCQESLNYSQKKTIMIDLDGVLNEYKQYNETGIPKIRDGAKEFIKKLSDNYNLVLFTSRNSKTAVKWLIENNLDEYFQNVTNVKTPAYIYLDDRGINFNGNYENALKDIENFKVYWK